MTWPCPSQSCSRWSHGGTRGVQHPPLPHAWINLNRLSRLIPALCKHVSPPPTHLDLALVRVMVLVQVERSVSSAQHAELAVLWQGADVPHSGPGGDLVAQAREALYKKYEGMHKVKRVRGGRAMGVFLDPWPLHPRLTAMPQSLNITFSLASTHLLGVLCPCFEHVELSL